MRALGVKVRRHREAASLSQEAVAHVLGIPRSAVSLMEAGKRDISALELRKLGDVFGVHPTDFFDEEAVTGASPLVLTVSSVRFRTGAREPAVERRVDECLAGTQEKVSQAERLFRLVSKAPGSKEVWGLPRDYADRLGRLRPIRQGHEAAAQERLRLGLGDGPIDDLTAVLDRHGVLVWGQLTEDEPPLDGVSLLDSESRPMVFCFSRKDRVALASYRWRFTIAHEFAHLLFDFPAHERQPVADVEIAAEGRGNMVEQRANAFAAAFLMPENGLRSALQALGWEPGEKLSLYLMLQLQREFRVSFKALGYRLQDLGFLSERDWERMGHIQPQLLTVAYGIDPYSPVEGIQASPGGWMLPRTITSLAVYGLQSKQLTLGAFAEVLNLDARTARGIALELDSSPEVSPGEARGDFEALRAPAEKHANANPQ